MGLIDFLDSLENEAAKRSASVGGFFEYSNRLHPSPNYKLTNVPAEVEPREYQLAAIEAIEKFPSVIVGLKPGLGKTLIATVAGAQLGKTLVVCPPSLIRTVWENEIRRLYPRATVQIITGTKRGNIPSADFTIIGDAVISSRLDDLLSAKFDTVVFDECHRYKTTKAQRTKAAMSIGDEFRNRGSKLVLLSGTISVNNAAEVYGPAKIAGIAKGVGTPTFKAWQNMWCITQRIMVKTYDKRNKETVIPVTQIIGSKNADVLHRKLRENGYYAVNREDILDLPDKITVERIVYPSSALMAEYRKIERKFLEWLEEISDSPADVQRALRAEKLVQMGALSQAAGIAKIPFVVEYAEQLVEEGEQVVVMAHHKEVVKELYSKFESKGITAVTYTGDESSAQKANAYDRFRSGKAQVFIGNIQAAGTGLNLEVSSNIIFAQLPHSAGDFEQASDRIYRMTQTRECTLHIPILEPTTVDAKIWKALQKKMGTTSVINTGRLEGVIDSILD